MIGSGSDDTISHSRASGNIHADSLSAGGLAGSLSSTTITDSYATGNVYSGEYGGGLIGSDSSDTIDRVYASGDVDGDADLGGLIGSASSVTVSDSFTAGTVNSGASNVGGIAGYSDGNDIFTQDWFWNPTSTVPCVGSESVQGCQSAAQVNYFTDKTESPFTQSRSEVWLGSVWNFDGTHLPIFGATSVDDDGISSAIENAAPNSGDANNDGTADNRQDNVASLVDPLSNHYAAIAVDSACYLSGVSVQSEASLTSDNRYNYPLGLLNFTADCGEPGFSTTVTQYYYNPPSGDFVLRKLVNGVYQTISGATISRQTIGGTSVLVVSYTVTDGGPLDADGTVNDTIVDPAGPALVDNATLTDTGENIALIAGIAAFFIASALVVRYQTQQSFVRTAS